MYVLMNISKRIELYFINQGISSDAEEMACVYLYIHVFHIFDGSISSYIFPSHLYIVIFISFCSSSSLSPNGL